MSQDIKALEAEEGFKLGRKLWSSVDVVDVQDKIDCSKEDKLKGHNCCDEGGEIQ